MNTLKHLLLLAIICVLVLFIYQVCSKKPQESFSPSPERLFQVAGKPVKTLNQSLTLILGVTSDDERKIGEILTAQAKEEIAQKQRPQIHHANKNKERLESFQKLKKSHEKMRHLQSLLNEIAAAHNPHQFKWIVLLNPTCSELDRPNASAIPGGTIIFTEKLYDLLENDAERIAVLGHEKGHIDLGHCIDRVRVSAKTGETSSIADILHFIIISPAFNKTQEQEADQYAFETLISLSYDPKALSTAFEKLQQEDKDFELKSQESDVLNEIVSSYFRSHPSAELRIENWRERANTYKQQHPSQTFKLSQENSAPTPNPNQ